jgi:large subunit ribosomal protein L9
MKVVFLEDVPNVAKAGDVKTVADGYGRNYLLPKKMAVISRPGAETTIKAQIEARAETEKMKKMAAEIDGKELVFEVKAGAKDRMHGSITPANIATRLQEVTGQAIDKRKIGLEDPIKALGSYDIAIKLMKGIEPKIKINIIKKEEEAVKEAAPATDSQQPAAAEAVKDAAQTPEAK